MTRGAMSPQKAREMIREAQQRAIDARAAFRKQALERMREDAARPK